mgnify:CR=1 FL=1
MELVSQPDRYSCGAASVCNALIALGETPDYENVKTLAGTTYRDGTIGCGIRRALEKLGFRGTNYRSKSGDNAWKFILRHCSQSPIILSVDKFRRSGGRWGQSHWVTIVGIIGDRVIVADSGSGDGTALSIVYDKNQLLERWASITGSYHGIRVSRA